MRHVVPRLAGLVAVWLLLGLVSPSWAQEGVRVSATADAVRIGQQDTLEFQVQVEGEGFTAVEPPDLRDLADFDVLDGPRRVQRQTIINGRFSAAVQYLWTLGPRRTGTLSVPALTVRVDGARHVTDAIQVQVVPGSVATRVPQTDAFGRRRSAQGEVLLLAELDRPRAFVGEQVTFTLRLLTQLRVRGMAYQPRPDFPGFWAEKEFDHVEDPPGRVEGRTVTRDGKQYTEFLLARIGLFPTTSGRLQVDPVNLQLRISADRGDPFGSFFFDREQTVLRRSAPLELQVDPLPQSGQPASFAGAVGRFRLAVAVDRGETVVNDAVGLTVTVEGEGNLRGAAPPALPGMADFRAFDPTLEEEHGYRDGRFRGTRSWDFVLVPLAPGDQTIPPVEYTYFDPSAAVYRTLRSDPVALRVARGGGPEAAPAPAVNRRDVLALGQDIHFLKLAPGRLPDRGRAFHRRGAYWALLGLPLVLNTVLLGWRLRADRLRADAPRRRALAAGRNFRRALRAAANRREAGDAVGFHAAVAGALTGLVADRTNLAAAGLTRERIRAAVAQRWGDPETARELEHVLDRCDAARFAAARPDPGALAALERRARDLGRRLERRR